MPNFITADELKSQGVTALEQVTSDGSEALISVKGKPRYVILSMDTYNHLRECELEAALIETKKDLRDGRVIKESVEKHLKRMKRG
jgi:PHD/YefM family antitoxin component YafN of YafNO toxin-antitoxin module